MDQQIIRWLDSSISADRRRAVRAMAQSEDMDWLPTLAALYKTESDPEIRALVAKAARYLRRQVIQPAPAASPPLPPVAVSAANEKRARDLLDRALNLSLANDHDAARDLVAKAYHFNPNLPADAYQSGLVGTIMGVAPADAFLQLDSEAARGQQRRRSSAVLPEISEGRIVRNLLVYGGFIAAFCILVLQLLLEVLRTSLTLVVQRGAPDSSLTTQAASLLPLVGESSGPAALYGLAVGLISVLFLLLLCLFIHTIARVLRGRGSYARLLQQIVPIYGLVTIIPTTLGLGFLAIVLQNAASVDLATVVSPRTSNALTSVTAQVHAIPIVAILQVISALGLLLIWVISIRRVARTYEFGWLRSLIAQTVSGALLSGLLYGFFLLFSSLFTERIIGLLPVGLAAR